MQRTGRTTPLAPLASKVKVKFRRGRAEVFFASPSDEWDLTLHHRGYSVRETKAFMRIPLLSGPVILQRRKPYSVPARPIWPSDRTVVQAVNRNIRRFIAAFERRGG